MGKKADELKERMAAADSDVIDPEMVVIVEEVPVEVVPELGKHILVDLGAAGDFALMDAPEGWNRDRTLTISGRNVEHVSDHATGVWQYRAM